MEPFFRLSTQARLWEIAYVGCILACGFCFYISSGAGTPEPSLAELSKPLKPLKRERLLWVLWALIPSSLTLSVTQFFSMDIASFPLLWIVPLSLYLLSFVIAFSGNPLISEATYRRVFPVLIIGWVVTITSKVTQPVLPLMALHLAVLFAAAGLFHSKLAKSRPHPSFLTDFYLWIAVGGVLGGIFNAILAPLIFSNVTEYPFMVFWAVFFYQGPRPGPWRIEVNPRDLFLPALLGACTALLIGGAHRLGLSQGPVGFFVLFGIPAVVCFLSSKRAMRFSFCVLAVWGVTLNLHEGEKTLFIGRSFFGVNKVILNSRLGMHELFHGSTLHGSQAIRSPRDCEPLTYYHRNGPLGRIFQALQLTPGQSIGVLGLGAGSVACYGLPKQKIDFYEIDPMVAKIARDPRFFTFLENTPAQTRVILGDGRLSLSAAPGSAYDLLILDAYSSDSVPVHLLTREAVALYLSKLTDSGILAFHISNRNLDLGPVLQALARDLHLQFREKDHEVAGGEGMSPEGETPSSWAVLARHESDLKALANDRAWDRGTSDLPSKAWTDDYSSLVRVLRGLE